MPARDLTRRGVPSIALVAPVLRGVMAADRLVERGRRTLLTAQLARQAAAVVEEIDEHAVRLARRAESADGAPTLAQWLAAAIAQPALVNRPRGLPGVPGRAPRCPARSLA